MNLRLCFHNKRRHVNGGRWTLLLCGGWNYGGVIHVAGVQQGAGVQKDKQTRLHLWWIYSKTAIIKKLFFSLVYIHVDTKKFIFLMICLMIKETSIKSASTLKLKSNHLNKKNHLVSGKLWSICNIIRWRASALHSWRGISFTDIDKGVARNYIMRQFKTKTVTNYTDLMRRNYCWVKS